MNYGHIMSTIKGGDGMLQLRSRVQAWKKKEMVHAFVGQIDLATGAQKEENFLFYFRHVLI